jgi:hypothetical protein
MVIAAASVTPAAGNTMVFFGLFLIVGVLFVGLLILGAALAAKLETRNAGLWIMGVTFAIAVALPLAWFFAGFAAPAQAVARGGDGRMIAATHQGVEGTPINAMFGIALFIACLVGLIALVANQRTRKLGFAIAGGLFALCVVYLVVGSASLHVEKGTSSRPAPVENTRSGDHHRSITITEEAHRIPVEQSAEVQESVASPVPKVEPNRPAPTAPEPPSAAPTVLAPALTAKTEAAAPRNSRATPDHSQGHGDAEHAATPESIALLPSGERAAIPMSTGDKDSLPEWAKQGGGIGPDGIYFTVVKCGPNLNFDSCWNELRREVDEAARDYRARSMWGDDYHPPNRPMPEHIRDQLMAEHFLEKGDSSVGETMSLYTRVVFSPQAMSAVRAWQKDLLAEHRTLFATIFGGLIVGLVGVTYGYFRIDTATLGYYTWRLRFIALFFVVGIVISGVAAGTVYFEEEWRLGGFNF